ncbi:MAG TPA: nucleotidyltransferase family protein [Actinomycetes bacterium]|nr:nucleotidyltransferase family protein [Actinomycetes bacterium]
MNVTGLVLAAGEGRRLGTPKSVLEVGGRRLVDRAVDVLRQAGLSDVVVVAGARSLDVPGARVVDNPEWRSGMGSSLRAGLAAASAESAAVVVMLVDTPGLGPAVVLRLMEARDAGAQVVVATYDGAPRNPVLFAREHWAEVGRLAVGDVGARPFLSAYPDLVTYVECGDVGDPADVDTPEDLRRFKA